MYFQFFAPDTYYLSHWKTVPGEACSDKASHWKYSEEEPLRRLEAAYAVASEFQRGLNISSDSHQVRQCCMFHQLLWKVSSE